MPSGPTFPTWVRESGARLPRMESHLLPRQPVPPPSPSLETLVSRCHWPFPAMSTCAETATISRLCIPSSPLRITASRITWCRDDWQGRRPVLRQRLPRCAAQAGWHIAQNAEPHASVQLIGRTSMRIAPYSGSGCLDVRAFTIFLAVAALYAQSGSASLPLDESPSSSAPLTAGVNINPKRIVFDRTGRSATIYLFNQGRSTGPYDITLVDRPTLSATNRGSMKRWRG